MIRKKDLEILLSTLKPHPEPKLYWEQYTIPSNIAADILYWAECSFSDITGKKIIELGCGTGIISIGASILGAREVFGVDIDTNAIAVARENQISVDIDASIHWIVSDVQGVRGRFDTVIQNPPFGVRRKGADRDFIEKALEIGGIIYTIHHSNLKNRKFIRMLVETCGGEITHLLQLKLKIPWMFPFHRKEKKMILVDLYRVVKL